MGRSVSTIFIAALLLARMASAGFCGGKKIVCVLDLEDKSGSHGDWRNIGTGMGEMMVTALSETKKYTIVERSKLEAVMDEQKLDASGAVTAQTAAKIGKLLGANIILTGAVTEFGIKDSKIGLGGLNKLKGLSALGGGGAKVSTTKARAVIDVRAIDTTSGQILASASGEGSKSSSEVSSDLSIAPDFDFGKEGFDETILGKAAREAVDTVVAELTKKFDEAGDSAVKIIKIAGDQIFINSGSTDGEKVGHVYVIYRPGEDMTDPDTGESLGSELEKVGTAKVVKVNSKYSVASTKAEGLAKSDILKAK